MQVDDTAETLRRMARPLLITVIADLRPDLPAPLVSSAAEQLVLAWENATEPAQLLPEIKTYLRELRGHQH